MPIPSIQMSIHAQLFILCMYLKACGIPGRLSIQWVLQGVIASMQDFPHASVGAMSLLNKLLTYDPAKRLSARAALRHSYFQEQPPPKQPADFPTFPSAHDTGLRQKHQRRCLTSSAFVFYGYGAAERKSACPAYCICVIKASCHVMSYIRRKERHSQQHCSARQRDRGGVVKAVICLLMRTVSFTLSSADKSMYLQG